MSCLCREPGSGGASKGGCEKYGRNKYHGGSVPDLSRFSSEARE